MKKMEKSWSAYIQEFFMHVEKVLLHDEGVHYLKSLSNTTQSMFFLSSSPCSSVSCSEAGLHLPAFAAPLLQPTSW